MKDPFLQVVDYDTNRAKGIKTSDGKGVDPNDQDFVNRVHQSPLPAGQAEKHFVMRDKHSGQELDHLQMIQIELPRCNVSKLPVSGEAISNKDWWMRILKYSDEYTSDELQKAENVPTFVTEAFNRLTFSKWDPVMVQEYKESVVDRGKYSTVLQVERAEGKAEGELRKAHEVARALMDKKMDDTFIAETTGLLLAEVQALRASF